MYTPACLHTTCLSSATSTPPHSHTPAHMHTSTLPHTCTLHTLHSLLSYSTVTLKKYLHLWSSPTCVPTSTTSLPQRGETTILPHPSLSLHPITTHLTPLIPSPFTPSHSLHHRSSHYHSPHHRSLHHCSFHHHSLHHRSFHHHSPDHQYSINPPSLQPPP